MSPDQLIGGPPPRRRLVHRLPKSLRQHWKLLVVFVGFVTVMATVFGATRIRPQITGDSTVIASEITENIIGTVDLFDASVTHEVSLDITDAEYQDMIATFQKSGDKKWVTADLTIDGTFIDDVSIRLKGNSTLAGVRGEGAVPGGTDFQPPEGMEMPSGGPMAGSGIAVSVDDPTSLPLLISFDENVSGRAYQGLTELSVRPGAPVLNEALALSLTAATDQPTQRYTYTVYSINGGATSTRLLLEHPDDSYANSLFESDGYLYKADANSRFEYVGDDQSDYADQFKQINAVGSGNLQPVVNFLKWLDGADEAEFDAHLSDRVDVESFARYVATQNLLANGDDMSGPGQNYYLWYDFDTEKITVVSWDLNLAMQGGNTAGPHDTTSMMGPGGMDMPGGAATVPTAPGAVPEMGEQGMPAGPGGQQGRGQPPQGGGPGRAGAEGFGMGMNSGNALKTRFLESDAFTAMYENAYWELAEQIYDDGLAAELLDRIAETVPVTDGLSAETLNSKVAELRTWIDQRTTALADLRAQ